MILVTGATGHVGNVLIRELLGRKQHVRALIYPGESTASLNGLDIDMIEGDVLIPADVREAFAGVDYVYHLAGLISIGTDNDDLMRRVNVQGTRNVALAARESGVKRMVYVSSIHALTRPAHNVVIDETLPFDPDNPAGEYDRSKASASLIVQELAKSGLNAVIVCPTGIVGPHDYRLSEMGAAIVNWMKKKLHFMVEGWFDFVDVRDVVQGLIVACERGKIGETYLLSGTYIKMADFRNQVQSCTGIASPMIIVPGGIAKLLARAAIRVLKYFGKKTAITPYSIETVQEKTTVSSLKAREHLDYSSRPIALTIRETVDWWKENAAFTVNTKWPGKAVLEQRK